MWETANAFRLFRESPDNGPNPFQQSTLQNPVNYPLPHATPPLSQVTTFPFVFSSTGSRSLETVACGCYWWICGKSTHGGGAVVTITTYLAFIFKRISCSKLEISVHCHRKMKWIDSGAKQTAGNLYTKVFLPQKQTSVRRTSGGVNLLNCWAKENDWDASLHACRTYVSNLHCPRNFFPRK